MTYLERETWAVRVKRGVAWMDEHQPGWAKQIDTSRLQMSHGCRCILGQTCGSFWAAIAHIDGTSLGAESKWAVEHGLNVGLARERDDAFRNERVFVLLTELWLPYVIERQQGRPETTTPLVNVRELVTA